MEHAVNRRQRTFGLVMLAAVAGSVAACGSSGPSQSAGQQPASSGTSQHHGGGARTVTIDNFKFAPSSLTVSKAGRITVSNDDSTTHTATADDGHSFDTGNIDPGASATVSPSKPGSYKYHCSIHPFMHGTLVVK
jgi:plastocyanin